MYSDLFRLNTTIFRYFNVYGPREPIKGPYAPVVGLFLRQKRAGEPLTIVGDGTQRRDFTHVIDVVEANMLAMKTKTTGHVFNIGTGINHSVIDLARMISDIVKFIPPRPGEAKQTQADISKAEEHLGWSPTQNIVDYIKEELNK